MPLDPQARAMLDAMAAMPSPDFATLRAADYRAALAAMPGFAPGDAVAAQQDLSLDGPAGPLQARLYRPDEPNQADGNAALPLVIYFHGGGFVLCGLDSHDNICRSLARRSGALVLSVDYRLAPEARFPAAADDAVAAVRWAAAHAAQLGADPTRLAVAGDSAGGNLAAVACQQLRGSGIALRHQLLLYPWLDCSDGAAASASYRDCAQGYFLGAAELDWYRAQYLATPADADDVRASPLRQRDLHGLPPATIITAEFDPLRDQGEAYGAALQRAGGSATVRRWPGQIHGFASMQGVMEAASHVLDAAAAALRQAFGNDRSQEAA
ncbi:alpha/beta hydrolase [Cupriavidus taiwanensis]|uniref:Putative esterase/lipase exported protein n=1 Tax=Cupriavidus taiwanensis TaxID=164546 RepID=A0A375ING5_9BURK|nr:alpha/beta hydrolase [Cupriavidus taiwanensis]SOZ30230.1 putative esterase/lipase; putative exported protein [Cupriavidus taiwanensis]SPA34886.1 putative esterase/lipase; putative exported protein [Cupriavidus taiwanensis]SPK75648.1 putative esterase/lipase exported protein [Cupriavidus taiwanensis]